MKEKIKIIILVILAVFITGCMSKKRKIELITEELNTKYNDFEIIDNCSYWNESGGQELHSIIKVNNEYKYISAYYNDNKNNLYKYDERVLEEFNIFEDKTIDGYITINKENIYVLFINVNEYTKNELKELIIDKALNYELKQKHNSLYVMFSTDFCSDTDIYKKLMLSTSSRCSNEYFKKYKKDANLIGYDSDDFAVWLDQDDGKIISSINDNLDKIIY